MAAVVNPLAAKRIVGAAPFPAKRRGGLARKRTLPDPLVFWVIHPVRPWRGLAGVDGAQREHNRHNKSVHSTCPFSQKASTLTRIHVTRIKNLIMSPAVARSGKGRRRPPPAVPLHRPPLRDGVGR